MDSRSVTWQKFLRACLRKRISTEKFLTLVQACSKETEPPSGTILVRMFFEEATSTDDPRLPLYLKELLHVGKCEIADILIAMLAIGTSALDVLSSASNPKEDADTLGDPNEILLSFDSILQMLTAEVNDGIIASRQDAIKTIQAMDAWLTKYPMILSLGYLIAAALGQNIIQQGLGQDSSKDLRISFLARIAPYIEQWSQTDVQLASTLDFWHKQYGFSDDMPGQSLDYLDGVDLGALSFRNNVLDSTPMNSRAGLYIYFNSLVCLSAISSAK